jgi:hypothetical protein
MAAPAFVSATAHSGNPTTAPSVTLPTTAANDILILVGVNAGATTAITPGGTYNGGAWTSIDSGTWTTGWGGCFWSRATGNHSGQTVTGSTTDSGSLLVVRISGATTVGSPIDINVSGQAVGAIAGAPCGTFNTTVADALVCYCIAADDNQTITSPTKAGVAMSNLSTAASTGGNDSGVGYANAAQAATGATGNFAATNAAGTAQGKRTSAFAIIPDDAEINDSSSNNRDAVVHGLSTDTAPSLPSGWSTNVLSLSPGQFLEATYELTATTGTGITTAYNPFTSSSVRSFGAWVKRTDTSGGHTIWGSSGGGLTPTLNLSNGSQDVLFTPAIFGTNTTWTSAFPGNGTWYFVGLVFDDPNDKARLYINGRLVSEQTNAAAYGGSSNALTWGTGSALLNSTLKGSISNPFVVEGNISASDWAWLAGNRYERTVDVSATSSIATAGLHIAPRSAAISAATAIATTGTVESGTTTHSRSAAISATTSIASTGTFWTTFTRSAALTAASGVTSQATFWSTLTRQAALSAATSIASDGYGILARSAALSAATSIESSGSSDSIILGSAAISAATSIAATGLRRHHRSAAVSAQASIATTGRTTHIRSAAITATTSLDTAPTRELLRSVVVSAVTDIQAGGSDIETFTRSASLSAATAISSAGAKVLPWNYNGGTLSSYSGGTDFTYLAGTASTYGPDPGWSYGGTASPTYTYGG